MRLQHLPYRRNADKRYHIFKDDNRQLLADTNKIVFKSSGSSFMFIHSQFRIGIRGGICRMCENALKNDPDIQAVLIVSPTYDGMVSDVKAHCKDPS